MIVSTATLTAAQRGFRKIFMDALHGDSMTDLEKVAMMTDSTSAEEVYEWLGAIPGMKELLGEVKIENLIDHAFTIRNREWHDTIEIKQADVERDKLGKYRPLLQAMSAGASSHKKQLVADLLSNGFTNLCYDGKAFFATNHKAHAKAAVWSNKGTAVLSAAAYSSARAVIKGRKNASGNAMGLGRDLVLVVPPALEQTGLEILVAERTSNGATNVNKGTARLEVWPELTSDVAWFLLDMAYPIKPFILQEEKPLELNQTTDPNDSYVLLNKKFLFQAYARYNAGNGLPEVAWGSTGAG